jgi:hypothetical protein
MMPVWRRTLNIKQFLDPSKPLARVRDPMVSMLRLDGAYDANQEFAEIVDWLAEAADVEDFDTALADLYDWADQHRIWMGP